MPEIDWTSPQKFTHEGLTFAYWDAGPKDSLYPPVIFCHGFPELAYSWRHQMEGLSDAGFRCIAMDQRGYGQSAAPEAVDDYTLKHLCGDMKALCSHLGLSKVVFCGHDWGGLIVWQMPLRYPELCAGVISLNTPYTKRAPQPPISLYRRRFGDDFYIVWFQDYGVAESVMDRDVGKTMTYFSQRPPEPTGNSPDTREGSSLRETLATFDISEARPSVMSEKALDFYVEQFKKTGFRGPVNWYRNFNTNWAETEWQTDRLELPCLMVLADLDPVLPPSAADGMERYVLDLEKVLIRQSGHWTQQEQPEAVNQALSKWIKKRF